MRNSEERIPTNGTMETESKPKEPRRGSNLLSAAGVGIEKRRRSYQAAAQYRVDSNEVVLEDRDGNVTRLEIVKVHEKQGSFRKAVPHLPFCLAVFFCILNVLLPSFGTLLGALSLLCGSTSGHETTKRGIGYGLLAAILQLLLTPVLIGWVWSIKYGVNMVQESMSRSNNDEENQAIPESP